MHRHVRRPLTGALLLILVASPFALAAQHSHSYDVLHYDVTLTIDIEAELVSGNTLIKSTCVEPGLDYITLDLAVLTVDSVLSQGTPLAYSHDDQVLMLNLAHPYAPGDTFEVQVFYHGHPGNTGPDEMGGFYFEGVPKLAFQVGINRVLDRFGMAKYWIPCWDWPCDKATAEYHITVPGTGKKVICNGVLAGVDRDSLAGTVTYHWLEDYPIAPGLMTVNAGRFAEIVDSTYDWISYWVYPRLVDNAIINFENVPAMLDVLSEAFGPYPFPKCAYVAVPAADVGHQNCITYPTLAVTPTHGNDWHVSEGLARQWWGASVTPADWRDLWLTESFGRYGQPLFEEATLGTEAYHDYIYKDLMLHTFADADPGSPIYDPAHPGGHTIYEKGTVVLHMLRFVLGDSVFFDALRTFSQTYAYSCATTADFQSTAEAVSGQDLDWFFSEWIYDCGWPEFEFAWNAVSTDSGWTVNLVMDQIQQIGPVFTMPMEISLSTATGDTIFQIWIDEGHEEYALLIADTPSSLVLDPNHWVLMKSWETPYAGVNEGERLIDRSYLSVYPNPTRRGTVVRYCVPTPQCVTIEIFDVSGRLVAPILMGCVPAGPGNVVWDGMSFAARSASPGVYFCRMVTGRGAESVRIVLAR
jgi:aminopeptidase N